MSLQAFLPLSLACLLLLKLRKKLWSGMVRQGRKREISSLTELMKLSQYPILLRYLQDIEEVVVINSGQDLGYFPPALFQLTSLVKLCLPGSGITYVPYSIVNLQSLTVLNLSRCQLTSLSSEVGSLQALEDLDVSFNKLRALPRAIGNLKKLKFFNAMGNQLTQLPQEVGQLLALQRLGLKGNCLEQLPESFTSLSSLVELFLTSNQLTSLPEDFGSLSSLVKLQCSYNPLTCLPRSLSRMTRLELMRFAMCSIEEIPEELVETEGLSSLCWCSLAGNPAMGVSPRANLDGKLKPAVRNARMMGGALMSDYVEESGFSGLNDEQELQEGGTRAGEDSRRGHGGDPAESEMKKAKNDDVNTQVVALTASSTGYGGSGVINCRLGLHVEEVAVLCGGREVPVVPSDSLIIGGKLGDGASGEVFEGVFAGEGVAVKWYHEDASPDGHALDDLALSCMADHPNLVKVKAITMDDKERLGAIMKLVRGRPLASKPTSQHLLRCRWPHGARFTAERVKKICEGVASALQYLHDELHVCHGDVYAHNVLVDDEGRATLVDMGAAFKYPCKQVFWQSMEVRAFGLFLKDMLERTGQSRTLAQALLCLCTQCLMGLPQDRPSFKEILCALREMR